MQQKKDTPLRSDAQRNRERILEVALAELTRSSDTPLSAIAKKAGVGQGTFYRNFPNREALVLEVYRYEVQQLADTAAQLLETRAPDRALREWMDRLAQYATAKAGLAEALRASTVTRGTLTRLGHGAVSRPSRSCSTPTSGRAPSAQGVTPDDFVLAIAGLWQMDAHGDWQPRAARLLDLVMDGLRVGAPSTPTGVRYGLRGRGVKGCAEYGRTGGDARRGQTHRRETHAVRRRARADVRPAPRHADGGTGDPDPGRRTTSRAT